MSKPELIIVGGANGSGKTTLALKYAAWQRCPYLGADAIAEEISPGHPERAAIAAGKEFVHRVAAAIREKKTIIIESTLAGRSCAMWFSMRERSGSRSQSHSYSSTPPMLACSASPSECKKVDMQCRNPTSGEDSCGVWGIFGTFTVPWPTTGHYCTIQVQNLSMSQQDLQMRHRCKKTGCFPCFNA